MREIKFRQWYDGGMHQLNTMFVGVGQIGWSDEHYVDLGWHDHEESEIMQYTGLKDKNGKEIYEGDIVKVYTYQDEDAPEFDDYTVHKIVWGGDYPAYDFEPSLDVESNGLSWVIFDNDSAGMEVIGNIYEHKDLLE